MKERTLTILVFCLLPSLFHGETSVERAQVKFRLGKNFTDWVQKSIKDATGNAFHDAKKEWEMEKNFPKKAGPFDAKTENGWLFMSAEKLVASLTRLTRKFHVATPLFETTSKNSIASLTPVQKSR